VNEYLLITDYPSIEGYVLSLRTLEKFFALVVGKSSTEAVVAITAVANAVETCFLIRVAHARASLSVNWISPVRCCELRGSEVVFDATEFLQRLLQKSGNHDSKEHVTSELVSARGRCRSDFRFQAHGHDMMELLAWYLRKRGHEWLGVSQRLSRTLLGCVDLRDLEPTLLFSEIASRAGRVTAA
jgi:hypothetical protein